MRRTSAMNKAERVIAEYAAALQRGRQSRRWRPQDVPRPVKCQVCRQLVYSGEAGFEQRQHAELIDCVRALASTIERLEENEHDHHEA